MFRVSSGAMALLFAFAAAVNLNDPDPGRWVALYVAACGVALHAALRERMPSWPALAVGLVALVWALTLGTGIQQFDVFGRMFESWEMKNVQVEEARETGGLLITAGWMAAILVRQRLLARQRKGGPG
jgi:hypothetical protein